jgi:tryptophan synthase alpha chain
MSRIAALFERLRGEGRKALVPFVTAGDPSRESTVAVMHGLVAGGADLIELGVPFSDPMADGPVIQRSSERALARKVGTAEVFGFVREFRRDDALTPVVLMGYLNPIEMRGPENTPSRRALPASTDCCWSTCPRRKPRRCARHSTGMGWN